MEGKGANVLTSYLTADRVLTREHVTDWREAVDLVGEILVQHGNATTDYVDAIKHSIEAPGGTYIDLGFGIALAHSRPESGVIETGLAVIHLGSPVLLAGDPDHPITVFIALAAQDSNSHLDLMQDLAGVLTDTTRRQELLDALTPADVLSALATKD